MKIGHTGITWRGDIEQAIKDSGELGYLGFETFGATILRYDTEGPTTWGALTRRYGIPTVAGYSGKKWIVAATQDEELDQFRRESDAVCEQGGDVMVVAAQWPEGRRQGGEALSDDQFQRLAEMLHQAGRHCRSLGLACALHPHTGTAIETRADIDAILNLLDPTLVGFAPDTGQIAKGGSDVLELLERYADRIVHVHLKDWNGRTDWDDDGNRVDISGYANYEPVGHGVLPMESILRFFLAIGFDGWVNVELDGTPRSPRPPREAARMSREYLGRVLREEVSWRRSPDTSIEETGRD